MKRLLLTASLLAITTTVSLAETQVITPPIRRIYVTSIGDVLEWQPGLGIIVLPEGRTRTVTRVTKRRVTSDGKSVIAVERPTRVERSIEVERRSPSPRPLDPEAPRALPDAKDEGESLMEEVERPRIVP